MKERKRWRPWTAGAIALPVVAATFALPVRATTLVRSSLEDLTAANGTVVVGEVLDSYSYWNEDGTFIFTDVKVQVQEVVKGKASKEAITVTLLGGTVGDLTALILGAPILEPEKSYLLFLNEEILPGAGRPVEVPQRRHRHLLLSVERL